MGVPYVFGNATTSIPLTNLDANFNTGLTIGNTTVGLGNTVTTLGNVTLSNPTLSNATANIASGNIAATTLSIGGTYLGGGDSSTLKNRIINGAMVIDQRNNGASVTPSSLNPQYILDRWRISSSTLPCFTLQQNAGSVTPPAGFTNYLGATVSTPVSSSSSYHYIGQSIEGFNIADLGWGTANAKTVTLSFWVYSSLTGTFGGSLYNNGGARSYPFTYSISSANTWTQVSITIAGDTSGTWLTTNGLGVSVNFGLGVSSTFSGTAGAWASATYFSATGATSISNTNGATFYITGVQLEVGSSATGYEYRQYGQELALCQRYYEFGTVLGAGVLINSVAANGLVDFKVTKRATPTGTYTSPSFYYNSTTPTVNSSTAASLNVDCFSPQLVLAVGLTGGNSGAMGGAWTASAEL